MNISIKVEAQIQVYLTHPSIHIENNIHCILQYTDSKIDLLLNDGKYHEKKRVFITFQVQRIKRTSILVKKKRECLMGQRNLDILLSVFRYILRVNIRIHMVKIRNGQLSLSSSANLMVLLNRPIEFLSICGLLLLEKYPCFTI